ncbi:integrating conjugative element protein [Pokkaliibacter sp. MBI-7]|uniref:integrating conjugative element protein n=1 Tax=Pokkaliibacter sp. MBI-7 TaxID=3040600 RepID=UPI002446D4A9|nr:integrating conjugative element protein [Pokkaliibacter sp. MBI-7]MDH2431019.1 integrating conjugative element protein [Pokkaliibacter sp. MBI-7]MDH2434791.1 integrating conjugative element protein [Pokkaliibacter sp. MBI-7]MDH2436714.1 integrating conjugative element protein [Pokkaliibacter sp. MBI-7]MDH2436814.1 integrating conjugative element protein [Pokkaliibacter sp. MBI-7]
MQGMQAMRWVVGGLLAVAMSQAMALEVVADHGGVPAQPYYSPINNVSDPEIAGEPAPVRPPLAAAGLPHQVSIADMLPVTSQLQPRRVARRAVSLPGMTPLFLVGYDNLSLQWLKVRGGQLQQMRATGVVVNVQTPAQLAELQRMVPGVQLLPESADDMGSRLQLSGYPVLITATAIEQ